MTIDREVPVACPKCRAQVYVPLQWLVYGTHLELECWDCGTELPLGDLSTAMDNAALLRVVLELYEDLPRLIREHSTP